MSCLFSIFSSSKNQNKKRPKLPTFDLREPKPTFCIYDSDDSDVENNNVKEFDIRSIKYYECCLGKGKICKSIWCICSRFLFLIHARPENFLFFPVADTFFADVQMDEKTLHVVPQSSYPRIRHQRAVVFWITKMTSYPILRGAVDNNHLSI